MAGISLSVEFNEEGSGALGFSFKDLDGVEMTPNTFLWTLTDLDGVVINSRIDVSETPAAKIWVLLQGDDLADVSERPNRIITIKGTYDSTLDGVPKTDIPYTAEYTFSVRLFTNIK